MKLVAFLCAIAIAVLSLTLVQRPADAQQPGDPEAVVRAMLDALNQGNIDAFASYLSDDATATGFCRPTGVCNTKAEIVAATSAEIAEGVQAEIRSLSVRGNTVTTQLTESAPAFAALGIQRVFIDVTFTVVDGKVTRFDDQLDLSDPQTATFAAALEGGDPAEPGQVPSTGDGAMQRERTSAPWLIAPVLLAGGALIVIGGGSRVGAPVRRRASRPDRANAR